MQAGISFKNGAFKDKETSHLSTERLCVILKTLDAVRINDSDSRVADVKVQNK